MSNKCTAYHNTINYLGKPGVCWGTKEIEPCFCEGDMSKCDFYENLRKAAAPKITNGYRLRAMSNYELAEFLTEIMDNCFALGHFNRYECNKNCPMYNCCNNQKFDNVEDWLGQEVKE